VAQRLVPKQVPSLLIDRSLVRDVQIAANGGNIHRLNNWLHAYEFASATGNETLAKMFEKKLRDELARRRSI
jgi:hypothetical protein